MITDQDMAYQVSVALTTYTADYDIPAIVAHLQREHGTIDIDEIDEEAFWDVVAQHDISDLGGAGTNVVG